MKMALREVSEGVGGTKTQQNSIDDSSISHSVVAKPHFLFSQHFYVNFFSPFKQVGDEQTHHQIMNYFIFIKANTRNSSKV